VGTGYQDLELDALEKSLASGGKGDLDLPPEEGAEDTDDDRKPNLSPHREAAIGYTIVFDSAEQQQVWFEFVKWLRKQFPDPDLTVAERLVAFLQETPPERRI
jgi:hypothetical protein